MISVLKKYFEILALVLIVLVPGPLFAKESTSISFEEKPFYDLYSETSAFGKERNLVNFTKLEYSFARINLASKFLNIFLSTGLNQDTKTTNLEIYNDNNVYLGAGFCFPLISNVILITELRYAQSLIQAERKERSGLEFRQGVVFYQFNDLFHLNDKTNIFDELYSEVFYNSRLNNNVFAMLKGKLGIRSFSGIKKLSNDFYIQLKIKADRLGNYYENLSELGVGVRPRYTFSSVPLTLSLNLDYKFGVYHGREYLDKNPNKDIYSEWEGLFVVGGRF